VPVVGAGVGAGARTPVGTGSNTYVKSVVDSISSTCVKRLGDSISSTYAKRVVVLNGTLCVFWSRKIGAGRKCRIKAFLRLIVKICKPLTYIACS